MAKLDDLVILIRMRVAISMWDALKLRISGAGYALKQHIEVSIEQRNGQADDEMSGTHDPQRNRQLS